MRNFNTKNGSFLKSKENIIDMIYVPLMLLIPFIILHTYQYGIYKALKENGSLYIVFKPLLYPAISLVTCLITEYIYYYIKKKKKTFNELVWRDFSIVPGLLIGLIVPPNIPIYLLIIGSIAGTLSKVFTGNLGDNKLNSAAFGSLVSLTFFISIYKLDMLNDAELFFSSLNNYSRLWKRFLISSPNNLSPLLSLLSFFYLLFTKKIKWRLSISCITSVLIISMLITFHTRTSILFPLSNVLSGNLLFASVFLLSDPITTPLTSRGQIIGGVITGILMMLFRYLINLPFEILFAILILNILTPFINYLSMRLYSNNHLSRLSFLVFIVVSIILTSLLISHVI